MEEEKKAEKWGNSIGGMQSLKKISRSSLSGNLDVRTAQVPAPGIPWSPGNACNANPTARVGGHISAQMFSVPARQSAASCGAALSSYPGANGGAFRHQKYPTINSAVTEIKEASCVEEYLACFQVLANTKPHRSKEALGVYDVEITGWCVTHFQLMVSHLLGGNVLDILGLDSTSLLQAKCHGHEASVTETEYPAMCREGRDQGTLGIITSQLFRARMRWWGKVFCNSWVGAASVCCGDNFAGFLWLWGIHWMHRNLLQFDHLT